ncbi:DsrE/DsrF/DrsH-like family protein [Magnetofaba australis]|uniref:Putative coenzyme A disulfide reductase n=1 Tax=Magnetofaba australis IT-1 TaxID=1434232 RepID=A0A1Y2K7I3_9PROT|nr:DsrE/DsrF/DrsH-like family protein [Magnetofaba australis]OSM06178.1 putative coenzyme A disulfide reductase [Magnetofaba australis IT-1]
MDAQTVMQQSIHNGQSSAPLDAKMQSWVQEELRKQVGEQMGALSEQVTQRLDKLEKRLPQDKVAIVVFSDDMDRALAAFVLANGALAMGMEVSMFFTFWGLSAIKRTTHLKGKAFKQKMLALMTPKRSEELGLSKMNMLGMGPAMMKSMMKQKNVASLEELREIAQEMGTQFIGCTMAMDLMGVDADELVEGVELGGVAAFMEQALNARTALFL